jgi:hypothetical protein
MQGAPPLPAAANPPPSKKKIGAGGIVFLVFFLGGLISLLVFFRHIFGSDVGGSCTDDSGCKPDAVCISKKCYRSCKTDGDCGAGFACGSTTVSKSPGGNPAKGYEIDDINICFPEEKMAGVREKQRQEEEKKRRR